MAGAKLADRITALEAEVARLKARMDLTAKPWQETIWGAFAGDPEFLEAMRLGREYRESFRPKARKRRKG